MRGRSYTPSPPRGYSRRGRSPSPRGRYGGRGRDLSTSLFVRNLRYDCRADDLRRSFGQFGPLKDIYMPKDFHTGELRGFGFVQYVDPADAAEAKYHMHGQILHDRELTVVFAEENRKKPSDMRAREGGGRSRFHDRRSPRCTGSQSRNQDYYSPTRKQRDNSSRSVSPQYRRHSRERWYPRHGREASYSRSPPLNGSRSQSPSPVRSSPSQTRSRSPTRSQSPNHEEYERDPRNRSPSRHEHGV